MIGLEVAANEAKVQYKDIAQALGITKQAINAWLKNERKIPPERIKQLTEIIEFQGIPPGYFSKTVNKVDITIIERIIHERQLAAETMLLLTPEECRYYKFNDFIVNTDEDYIAFQNAQLLRIKALARIENIENADLFEVLLDAINVMNENTTLINSFLDLLEYCWSSSDKYFLGLILHAIALSNGSEDKMPEHYNVTDIKRLVELTKSIKEVLKITTD